MIEAAAIGAATWILAQATVSETEAVAAIEAQRERFNEALVEGDLETIAEVLSEDVVLVAGTRSASSKGGMDLPNSITCRYRSSQSSRKSKVSAMSSKASLDIIHSCSCAVT